MFIVNSKLKKSLIGLFFLTFFIVIFLSSHKVVNFLSFYHFSTRPLVSNTTTSQLPLIPGQTIHWTKTVPLQAVSQTSHLLTVPSSATSIKISVNSTTPTSKNGTELTRLDLVKLSQENSQSRASVELAEKIKKERATGFWASLSRTFSRVNSLFATVSEEVLDDSNQEETEVTLVDLAPIVEEVTGEEITPEEDVIVEEEVIEETATTTEDEIIATSTEEEVSTTTEETTSPNPSSTEEGEGDTSDSGGGGGGGSEPEEEIDIVEEVIATSTASSTDLVVVEYETPAPVIAEAETDTGKIVSVSSDGEQEIITNVLAFTTIPEIFKVGQEDKIKIKWTNNGDQNVIFHAYDTDNNGKLDYVEWTVPHLSEQIFEIIFISKAFELDENQDIVNDVYESVFEQDDVWVTVPDTHSVRVTFEQILSERNDNTIYAKPTDTNTPVTIEVYPVYTDELGNVTRGSLLTTFPNITEEKQYRVLLTGLDEPTDMFDLKVVGGDIDFDFIVDPECPNSMAGTGVEGDECQITSWADLDAMRNGLDMWYELTTDLSSTTAGYEGLGDDWQPIGDCGGDGCGGSDDDLESPFTGNFNGNGNTISGLNINKPGVRFGVGFFAYIDGNVNNINLDILNITGSNDVGGLAGYSNGTISTSSVIISGEVDCDAFFGGLVGNQSLDGTIFNSHSTITGNVLMSYGTFWSGGLVGINAGTISDSSATIVGSLYAPEVFYSFGGLVGKTSDGPITNSSVTIYNSATLNGTVNTGLVIGENQGSLITSTYATIYDPQYGSIIFADWDVGRVDGGNLLDYISIGNNSAIVDSVNCPGCNKPATTTLTNTGITGGTVILKDGVACGDCVMVSSSGDDYTFTVTGWSTYSIEEPPAPPTPSFISPPTPTNNSTTSTTTILLATNVTGNMDDYTYYLYKDGNLIATSSRMMENVGVSTGVFNTCILKSDGNVDCYGRNLEGQSVDYTSGDAIGVSAGTVHTCILKSDGNVDCYGDNNSGQSVDYTEGDAISVSVSAYHTCIVKSNGNVDCYGDNSSGQSADYSGGDAISVSASTFYTCILKSDGNVDCYGNNSSGQSADYTGGDAIGISAGGAHTCILKSDGNVDCYGNNSDGQSVDYTGGDAIGISTGSSHTCILKSDGNVDCYGRNLEGQSVDYTSGDAIGVSAGSFHTCITKTNGDALCYGDDSSGQSVYDTSGGTRKTPAYPFFDLDYGNYTFKATACYLGSCSDTETISFSILTPDTTPPTGSITLADGAETSTTASPSITLTTNDASQYQLCLNSATSTNNCTSVARAWASYTATPEIYNFGSEEGLKTLYVQFKDAVGNISATYSDSITIDFPSSGGGKPTCTYEYSDWSICSASTQTRTVTPDPNDCSNSADELSRTCVMPPIATTTPPLCTDYTYSLWGECINSQKTRTTQTSIPTDCEGGATPTTTEACTIQATSTPTTTPPIIPLCTGYTYSAWSDCINSNQTRITLTSIPADCQGGVSSENSRTCQMSDDEDDIPPVQNPDPEPGTDPIKPGGGGNHDNNNIPAILNLSALVTENITVFGTTTEKVINDVRNIVESKAGDIVTKTITTAGVVGGGIAATGALAMSGVVMADLAFLPFKLWALLLSVLGLKKRNRPWGTVYDSVTKQPIDPAYVTLKNLETNEETTSITDLDGRYGFLVPPGTYTLSAHKTNYDFPSKKSIGKIEDVLYTNLYLGGEIIIPVSGAVISKNIPLDPIKFDWNEFVKGQKKLMKFYSKREKLVRIITDWFFRIGFIVSLISLFLVAAPYNYVIFGLYIILVLLRKFGLKQKALGSLTDKEGNPLSFAIVRVYDAELKVQITNKVANQIGKYYCLVNNGKYYVTIEKKNEDESYSLVHTSEVFEAKEGIVNRDVNL